MRLRSQGSDDSSSKGKAKIEYRESSGEDDDGLVSPDSDYNALSEEDEDFSKMLEQNGEEESMGLNFALDNAEVVDEAIMHNIPKRRRNRRNMQDYVGEEMTEFLAQCLVNLSCSGAVEDTYVKKTKTRKKKGDRPVLMWEVWEQENERWIADNLAKDMDLINQNEMSTEVAEPSDDLIIPLLRYQKEWLAWALKQEESATKGGILADEMGMGKTLQAIALVLLKRKMYKEIYGHDLPSSSVSLSKELPSIKGTLVICPLVAVMQWVSEIQRFTSKGSTRVLVYHGANRARNAYRFSEYDFVITTYSIVEAEFRKYVMPPKDICKYCGKLFYDHKLKIHLKYMCGPSAVKTAKQSKQQKKEVKPKKMLASDVSTSRAGGSKGKEDYHVDKELENDCSINCPHADCSISSTGRSILHSVIWNRVILDEAHYIKERRSNTTRAVLALQSSYKWALSGTPLQNRVGELYSLVRFLQIVPYSYYFCKDCDCRTLDYSTTECPGCTHKSVRHFCWWNKYVASPIQDSGNSGNGRNAMLLLKHKILKSILLRRTKKGRAADLALPPRIVTLRRDSLDVVEEDYYTALYNESQAQFNIYIEAGTVLNNYAHIFDLLTRLRQAVDHPYLVEYSPSAMERKGKAVLADSGEKCSLCDDPEEDSVVTACGHVFCKTCLIDFGATSGQSSCPTCSKPLTVDFTANKDGRQQRERSTIKGFRASSILNRIQLDDFQTSTKIDALVCDIEPCIPVCGWLALDLH